MRRKGLGYGKGKGYFNLTLRDPIIHSLSARGIKSLQPPTVMLLPAKQFDRRFSSNYSINEVGYATTKIKPSGEVNMYVKHTGDYERTGDLIAHELNELEIWQDLVNKGVDPDKAEEMAHNMNPVKVAGVAEIYEVSAKGKILIYPKKKMAEEIQKFVAKLNKKSGGESDNFTVDVSAEPLTKGSALKRKNYIQLRTDGFIYEQLYNPSSSEIPYLIREANTEFGGNIKVPTGYEDQEAFGKLLNKHGWVYERYGEGIIEIFKKE